MPYFYASHHIESFHHIVSLSHHIESFHHIVSLQHHILLHYNTSLYITHHVVALQNHILLHYITSLYITHDRRRPLEYDTKQYDTMHDDIFLPYIVSLWL